MRRGLRPRNPSRAQSNPSAGTLVFHRLPKSPQSQSASLGALEEPCVISSSTTPQTSLGKPLTEHEQVADDS